MAALMFEGEVEVRDCVVANNYADPASLFVDNGSVWIDEASWVPNPSITLEIRGNTFVRSPLNVKFGVGWALESNVFFGADRGVELWGADPGAVVRCNNAWGNGTNWAGLPDPTGTDGNLSVDPLFCDADAGVFTLAANSPCLPENNSCGVQVGAFGAGCGPQSIEAASWGRIKAWHR